MRRTRQPAPMNKEAQEAEWLQLSGWHPMPYNYWHDPVVNEKVGHREAVDRQTLRDKYAEAEEDNG